MSKKFNIHEWQAKQRKQPLNEGVWEVGSKQDIQEFIAKLRQLKNVYYNIVGSDEVQNGLDAALRGAEELMKHAKPGRNEGNAFGKAMQGVERGDTVKVGGQEFTKKEHHDDEDFPGKDLSAWDLLDKLKSGDKELYDRVEDFMKSMKEMSMTGGGASFGAGNSMAHLGKKNKRK